MAKSKKRGKTFVPISKSIRIKPTKVKSNGGPKFSEERIARMSRFQKEAYGVK